MIGEILGRLFVSVVTSYPNNLEELHDFIHIKYTNLSLDEA